MEFEFVLVLLNRPRQVGILVLDRVVCFKIKSPQAFTFANFGFRCCFVTMMPTAFIAAIFLTVANAIGCLQSKYQIHLVYANISAI